MTHDMWHVTHDIWNMHMTGGKRWTFFQNFSFLALTVWEWRCSEDISTKDDADWLTKSMSNGGVCIPGYTGSVKYLPIPMILSFPAIYHMIGLKRTKEYKKIIVETQKHPEMVKFVCPHFQLPNSFKALQTFDFLQFIF